MKNKIILFVFVLAGLGAFAVFKNKEANLTDSSMQANNQYAISENKSDLQVSESTTSEKKNESTIQKTKEEDSKSIAIKKYYTDGEIILTENSLGPIDLKDVQYIDLEKLKSFFPKFEIKYDVGSGDSPNFHSFLIIDNGTNLFSIVSFIDKPEKKNLKSVHIDLINIYSPKIKDIYGVHVGMKYSEFTALRGSNWRIIPQHHDVAVGENKIFYSLEGRYTDQEENVPDMSPEDITKETVIKYDWKITLMSWPYPAW